MECPIHESDFLSSSAYVGYTPSICKTRILDVFSTHVKAEKKGQLCTDGFPVYDQGYLGYLGGRIIPS